MMRRGRKRRRRRAGSALRARHPHAPPDRVADRLQEHRARLDARLIRRHGRPIAGQGAQVREHVLRADSAADVLEASVTNFAIAIDYERRGKRNSAFLRPVEQAPALDHFTARIAQNRKGKLELAGDRFGTGAIIDRERDDFGAGIAQLRVTVSIIRQLAEAERSPMAAVEDQYDQSASGQLGQPARVSARVFEQEIRREIADGGSFLGVHPANHSRQHFAMSPAIIAAGLGDGRWRHFRRPARLLGMRSVTRFDERASLYEQDYYAWAREQSSALHERRFDALDMDHLAEEVEGLAKSERRELRNRLMRVLVHLLKCRFQPARRSRSWETTLISQRVQIAALLDDSPSLRGELPEGVERAYSIALRLAGREMGMTREQWERLFPARCPWSPKQILDEDFYPTARK